ncbi:MAG: hypothetical protein DRJ26_04860 [Candidatus Methanomethylicota archaeon]|uniref:Uncharacterized protein n=1 Tax=Thermoproteota archaeon TaxID=2056631 RepID=A0A497EY46_9CREN|nr:MAG: hypothetical protein DRJ26_04860 [Candidatus Verstraetearchaeota archaeon]
MAKKLTWLEKLETIIPGFSGYKKKELAREDDRLLRDYVYKVLNDARKKIEEAAAAVVDIDFTLAKRLNNLASIIMYSADKVKFAETGYAPHYHRVKVELDTLEKIKEIDNELVGSVERIRELASEVARIAPIAQIPSDKLTKISEELGKIDEVLNRRLNVLRGWSSETES